MNSEKSSGRMELLCEAVDLKQKMKALYAEAAGKCSDDVGTSTFRMLEELEETHLDRLREMQTELSRDEASFDSCRYYDFNTVDRREIVRRILRERKSVARACLDDIAAIETGLQLENRAIEYFVDRLKLASDPTEREFLNYLISEERAHYIVLADLKFYYADPEHWFMEKGRTDLDGAGVMS